MAPSKAPQSSAGRGAVTVVTGPARCGKTSQLLERYRQALAEYPARSVLWLAPTYRSVSDIVGRLLTPELWACFSPGVVTFEGFAQQVLEASGEPVRPLSGLMKRELLRFLIEQAHEAGELKYFGSIAGTHGLVDLVSQFISEFKRLEIWPAEFQRASQQRGQSQKDRELLAIYHAYQERLTAYGLYDAEGRFWSARAILRDGNKLRVNQMIDRLKLVVVDGFADFTRTQHEILEILAGRVGELLITLPLEPEPHRTDLFGKSLETLARLRERLNAEQRPMPRRRSAWPLMDHLESQLFQNPRIVRDAPDAVGVEILAASREHGEVEQIGHCIKELLLRGCDASGGRPVPPDDIAVVFRSLRGSASLVREVFTDLGIPFSLEAAPTLAEVPVCRAFTRVLSLAADDWPFRQVLAVLGNNYIRPRWEEWADGRGPIEAEKLVRRLQVPSGAKTLLQAAEELIEQLANEAEAREPLADAAASGVPTAENNADDKTHNSEESSSEAAARGPDYGLRVGLAYLKRLHKALARLPKQGTQGQWCGALEKLAEELGIPAAIRRDSDPKRIARDQAAWTRLLDALGSGDSLFRSLGEDPPVVDAHNVAELVEDLLRWEQLPRAHDDVGRVRVLSAASIRALHVPYLFFAGLSEKAFPSPERHDRLYSEAEYHRLREAGLPLPTRIQRGQDEMLLFYEVLTRAGRRLWLSYPAMNEKAEPLLPSPFLQEVIRAAGNTQLKQTVAVDLSPVPQDSEPASPRELRIRGMHDALNGDVGLLAGVSVASSTEVLSNIFDALAAMRLRGRREGFSVFEGLLESPAVQQWLAQRFPLDRPWSASDLEGYALCPYKFFLRRVLRIEPLEELALEADYLDRGSLLHAALDELHHALNERHGRPVSPAEIDEADLAEAWAEVLAKLELRTRGSDVPAAMRAIDLRLICKWLADYRSQHAKYDECWNTLDLPLRPTHFEVSFGQELRPGADPLATSDPLVLKQGTHELRLAGRIDRIDVGRVAGRQVFSIIDYKSGKKVTPPGKNAVPDGTALQLELYALAAEQVLFGGDAAALDAGYWFCRDGGYRKWISAAEVSAPGQAPRCHEGWVAWRDRIIEQVFRLAQGIKAGQFPVYSLDDNCTGRCEFATVCRVNQVRSLEKVWPPQSTH